MSQEHPSTQQGDYPLARIQERSESLYRVLGEHMMFPLHSIGTCPCGRALQFQEGDTYEQAHRRHLARKIAEWMEENR